MKTPFTAEEIAAFDAKVLKLANKQKSRVLDPYSIAEKLGVEGIEVCKSCVRLMINEFGA